MNNRNFLGTNNRRQGKGGFTLIEMIGVLAIIALLAAMLLPKVANAISDAKINNAAASYMSVETATTSHYGKYLAYNSYFGTNNVSYPIPILNYDTAFLIPKVFWIMRFNQRSAWAVWCRW